MAIITISGGTFSGEEVLAERVAEKLGYRCISGEVILRAAREYGMVAEKLSHALSDKPGFFEGMGLERVHALAYLAAALCGEIKNESIVYRGNAGHLLLKSVPHVIRVEIISSMESRAKAAMKHHNLNRNQAIEFIQKADGTRTKWTRFLFHVDYLDASLYDIIINLDSTSISSACKTVCRTADLEFQSTPDSQKRMDDLILSTKVRAMIAADGTVADGEVDIEAEGGIITIKGTVDSSVEADKIRKIVYQTPGVQGIDSQMRLSL
ncbi:cytidylate kinase family protein [Chloroflexota bacterium]